MSLPYRPFDPRGLIVPAHGEGMKRDRAAVAVLERWALQRQLYADNLKVILIAAIIASHAVVGYSALSKWAHADVREALVWTLLLDALHRSLGNAPGTYWAEFVGTSGESLDAGYLCGSLATC
jgi:hypothetical protein